MSDGGPFLVSARDLRLGDSLTLGAASAMVLEIDQQAERVVVQAGILNPTEYVYLTPALVRIVRPSGSRP